MTATGAGRAVREEGTGARYLRCGVDLIIGDAGVAEHDAVRGGQVEVLEGSWQPKRVVVVRFDSADAAHSWWDDPAHSELRAMRQRSTATNMILVEGIPNA